MAKRDGPSVRIHTRVIIRNSQFAQCGKTLGREGLVQLNHVHLIDGQSSKFQNFLYGWNRTYSHNAGRDTYGGHCDDARDWG
jgi:hypothetical protein